MSTYRDGECDDLPVGEVARAYDRILIAHGASAPIRPAHDPRGVSGVLGAMPRTEGLELDFTRFPHGPYAVPRRLRGEPTVAQAIAAGYRINQSGRVRHPGGGFSMTRIGREEVRARLGGGGLPLACYGIMLLGAKLAEEVRS